MRLPAQTQTSREHEPSVEAELAPDQQEWLQEVGGHSQPQNHLEPAREAERHLSCDGLISLILLLGGTTYKRTFGPNVRSQVALTEGKSRKRALTFRNWANEKPGNYSRHD